MGKIALFRLNKAWIETKRGSFESLLLLASKVKRNFAIKCGFVALFWKKSSQRHPKAEVGSRGQF